MRQIIFTLYYIKFCLFAHSKLGRYRKELSHWFNKWHYCAVTGAFRMESCCGFRQHPAILRRKVIVVHKDVSPRCKIWEPSQYDERTASWFRQTTWSALLHGHIVTHIQSTLWNKAFNLSCELWAICSYCCCWFIRIFRLQALIPHSPAVQFVISLQVTPCKKWWSLCRNSVVSVVHSFFMTWRVLVWVVQCHIHGIVWGIKWM